MKTCYWVKKIHRCFFLSFMIWYFHCMPNAWVAACILFTKWSFNLLLKIQAKYTAHWFLKNIQFSYVKYVSEGDIFHLFYSSCQNLRNSLAKSQCLPSCLSRPPTLPELCRNFSTLDLLPDQLHIFLDFCLLPESSGLISTCNQFFQIQLWTHPLLSHHLYVMQRLHQ